MEVATGWTGWTYPPHFLPNVVPEIDANPVIFTRGKGYGHVWSLTHKSLLYANFKVTILEFAYTRRFLQF